MFDNELLKEGNDILIDNTLSDIEKYEQLEELIENEGYTADDMFDFLQELSFYRVLN